MSRSMIGEYVLTGELVTRSALAVGSGEAGPDTDMACLRDGLGRLVIPGSALAGVLHPSDDPDGRWGGQALASLVYVEDAPATAAAPLETRDGVGIDRVSGTASPGVLYAREVVPPGTRFAFELRVEAVNGGPGVPTLSKEDAKDWITTVATQLVSGARLGSSTSTGLGEVRLDAETVKLQWLGMGTRDDLLAVLAGHAETEELHLAAAAPSTLRITVEWNPISPLLVSVPMNGLVDRLPQTTGSGATTRLVIPGASIKGVLRARAEKIVRTFTGAPAAGTLIDQMAADLGPVQRLFGRPPTGQGATRTKGQRGAATVGEVHSPVVPGFADALATLAVRVTTSVNATAAQRQVQKAKPRADAIGKLVGTPLRITPHVAISRWTGGADDGKLFATLAPGPWFGRRGKDATDSWDPITLDVDLERLGEGDQILSALRLLSLVLIDLAEGWIGLGYATSRGYGEISADEATIRFAFPAAVPPALSGFAGRAVPLPEFLAEAGQPLSLAWRNELAALAAGPIQPESEEMPA